ncbi:hypothetical protein CLAIMM_09822 isoform 2 [Cladophialophora immunda]|nr:hypothetical protein CLAIMM_09822 isoform 2 [Cladophialophora immunda]
MRLLESWRQQRQLWPLPLKVRTIGRSESPTSAAEPLIDKQEEEELRRWNPRSRKPLPNIQAALVHTLIFLSYSTILLFLGTIYTFGPNERRCAEALSTWSPAISAVEYELDTFKAAFNASTIYRSAPSPEVDAAWDAITNQPGITLSRDELVNELGKDPVYAVHLQQGGEELYTGFLEVFHQLHCVDMLRRYTHWDYYASTYPSFLDSADTLRSHLDHCIDVLRINLMCTSDVSVMTHHWIAEKTWPDPDFETRHKCRKFDAIVDWVNETPRKMYTMPTKPPDAVLFQPLLKHGH